MSASPACPGVNRLSFRARIAPCNHAIRWYDNIPVISYLILRGHCRDCQSAHFAALPIVELLTAIVLVLTFHVYGLGPEFIKYAVLA